MIAASVRQEFFKHRLYHGMQLEKSGPARQGWALLHAQASSRRSRSACAQQRPNRRTWVNLLANGAYELVPVLSGIARCRRPTDATRSGADPSFSYDGHDSFGDAVLSWFGDGSQVLASLGIAARQRDCRRDCCSRVHSTVSVGGRKRCYI